MATTADSPDKVCSGCGSASPAIAIYNHPGPIVLTAAIR